MVSERSTTGDGVSLSGLLPFQLVERAGYNASVVVGWDTLKMTPIGMDLTVGALATHLGKGEDVVIAEGAPLELYPGDSAIIHTQERLNLPLNWCGLVGAKVALVMKGLVQAPPIFVDFGFGYNNPQDLTVVIQNASPYRLTLGKGEPICRLVLFAIDSRPDQVYTHKDRTAVAMPPYRFAANPSRADVQEAEPRVSRLLYSLYDSMQRTNEDMRQRLSDVSQQLPMRIAALAIVAATISVMVASLKVLVE